MKNESNKTAETMEEYIERAQNEVEILEYERKKREAARAKRVAKNKSK